jgi:acyl-CoA thioesterase
MNDATKVAHDHRHADQEFFGLALDESGQRARFAVADPFSNPSGRFYGGAGVAATVALMEAATGRRALFTAAQFLSTASREDELDLEVDVRTAGKRSSQVQVHTTLGGVDVIAAIGATGDPRAPLTTTFDAMPEVPGPDACPVVEAMVPGDLSRSRFSVTEHRLAAEGAELAPRGSQVAFWARVEGRTMTPAMLAYVGDVVALGMFRAVDVAMAGATSLDNTLRVGPPVDTEWALLELHAHSVADGYGHGTVSMWAPDGTLLAMVSQTLVLRPAR